MSSEKSDELNGVRLTRRTMCPTLDFRTNPTMTSCNRATDLAATLHAPHLIPPTHDATNPIGHLLEHRVIASVSCLRRLNNRLPWPSAYSICSRRSFWEYPNFGHHGPSPPSSHPARRATYTEIRIPPVNPQQTPDEPTHHRLWEAHDAKAATGAQRPIEFRERRSGPSTGWALPPSESPRRVRALHFVVKGEGEVHVCTSVKQLSVRAA
jgi:hypothetical protein